MSKLMIDTFIFTLVLGIYSFAGTSFAFESKDMPKISEKGEVELSKTLKMELQKGSLKAYEPIPYGEFSEKARDLFELPDTPGMAKGDFNGDGEVDAFVLLQSKKEVKAVLILGGKSHSKIGPFKVGQRNKEEATHTTYLSLLAQKDVHFKNKKIKSKRDLIQVETYLGAVLPYYFDGKEFKEYTGEVP
ncbi:MAG TPA: hypothetical protein DCL41_07835 [Bdellovibrionales bacterium]|nr:hypothetical protein [Bdellovibrionales bacterium]